MYSGVEHFVVLLPYYGTLPFLLILPRQSGRFGLDWVGWAVMRLCHVIYSFQRKGQPMTMLLGVIGVENIETSFFASAGSSIAQGQIAKKLQTPIPSYFSACPHHPSPEVLPSGSV